jgi:hypothetical protein
MKIFGIDPHFFTESGMIIVFQKRWVLDIVKFDEWLSEKDPEYDREKCTWKGEEHISLEGYIKLKFGAQAVKLVEDLINGNFTRTQYEQ